MNITAGGATPLHIAADVGSPEVINCLLQAGANPNATDEVTFADMCKSFCILLFMYKFLIRDFLVFRVFTLSRFKRNIATG